LKTLNSDEIRNVIANASDDIELNTLRFELAKFAALNFSEAGSELLVLGQILGADRKTGASPFGNGSDAAVAVSTLMRIGAQLISASADLFCDGRSYAAAALVRQLVEVEYLAWAFETKHGDAEKWLRSDKKQREQFFSPRKLRDAAAGKFRSKDYGFHCELGGHPVPNVENLLTNKPQFAQLLLCDMLGHTGRIWEHFFSWSHEKLLANPIATRTPQMRDRFMDWKAHDPLLGLPPP
jgi:hypothetical protein